MLGRRTGAALAALAVLLPAACADDEPDAASDRSTTTLADAGASTSTAAPDADAGIDPLAEADREPKSGGEEVGPTALLVDVRVGRHEGYDRVVFEFRDRVPAWSVQVGEGELVGDPSGEPLTLAGADRLDVRFAPASGVEFTDEEPGYVEVYEGPDRVPGTGGVVTEAILRGDFEAVLLWSIGLGDPVEFRVQEMSGPPRLVVDARNH